MLICKDDIYRCFQINIPNVCLKCSKYFFAKNNVSLSFFEGIKLSKQKKPVYIKRDYGIMCNKCNFKYTHWILELLFLLLVQSLYK